jgi:hypothetical protein
MEAFAYCVGLRAFGVSPGGIDVLNRQIEFVFVMLRVAAIFRAPVGQNAAKPHIASVVDGGDAVIDEIGGGDRRLAVIKLGESDPWRRRR